MKEKRHLSDLWSKTHVQKAAREQLVIERAYNKEMALLYNAGFEEVKKLRKERDGLDPTKLGWPKYSEQAALLEARALAIEGRIAAVHQQFAASCIRVNDLVAKSGEVSPAHDAEMRRRRVAAEEANAAYQKMLDAEARGKKLQLELEAMDAPPK